MEFLQHNGEQMESEIAAGLHLPIAQIQSQLTQLSIAGDVIGCKVTRYHGEEKVEGTSYRLSGARSGKPLEAMPPPRKIR